MSEDVGFVNRAGAGLPGCAFMGKAHSNAFRKIPYMIYY